MSAASPRIRYYLALSKSKTPTVLENEQVIPWVRGYAAALGKSHVFEDVDMAAAEDTVRVQMLQIGDRQGWFNFMYQQRDEHDGEQS